MEPDQLQELADSSDRMVKLGSWAFAGFGALIAIVGAYAALDDPAALFAIPFGLIFVGAGWLMRRLFLTPAGKRRIVVGGDAFSARRHDGATADHATAHLIDVDADASEAEIAAARAKWRADRIGERADGSSGRIEQESRRKGGLYRIAAGLWSVVALLTVGAAWFWGDFLWIVAMGPVLVASALVFLAVRDALRRKKFGESLFLMAAVPARLGQTLKGVVETGIPYDRQPADGFRVTLSCRRRWEERTGSGSTTPTTRTMRAETIWEVEHKAACKAAGRGLAADVAIPLPSDLPQSTLGQSDAGVFWELEIAAAMPGLDYGARFSVPVLAPDSGR